MVQIRENRQKQLTARHADAGLWHTNTASGTGRMFVCMIGVLGIKENAP